MDIETSKEMTFDIPMTKLTPEQIKQYEAKIMQKKFLIPKNQPDIPIFKTVEEIKLHNQMCVEKINQLKQQQNFKSE